MKGSGRSLSGVSSLRFTLRIPLVLPWLAALLAACGGNDGTATSLTSFTTDGGSTTLPQGSSTGVVDSSSEGGMDAGASGSTSAVDSSTGDVVDSSGSGSDSTTGGPACDDEVDPVDINGLDENGDGIDGVACRAVFVNTVSGSDLNDGVMMDDPVQTIARGIEIAATYTPPRMVLVAEGDYTATVNIVSGVSIYGGYDQTDWARDIGANPTNIIGTEARTLIAQNLSQAVEVDGFTVRAVDYTDGSQTSYGVWVSDTPEGLFTLDYCTVDAGNGGAGADAAQSNPGADGMSGTNASGGSPGAGGTSQCNATGGNGGSGLACPATGGLNGAAGGDPTTVGQGGPAGQSGCGADCDDNGTSGTAGQSGHAGVNGTAGTTAGDNAGTFGGDGLWIAPSGAIATRGDHGSGGGGGGAGGYDVDSGIFCAFDSGNGIGGGGGGGGAGGCGGDGGQTGGAGGGSFGIVAFNSSISVTNTDILLGDGGAGGLGANGGDGGSPGSQGNGAPGIDGGGEPGNGNVGAAGGGGGGGGGGAGGCGGASIGIVTVGAAEVGVNNISFTGGVAGAGGSGGVGGLRANGLGQVAPDGDDGCDGLRSDQRAY